MTKEQLECKRLYFEALSKIPKRFIDGETRATDWSNERTIIANPKYAPMTYTSKTRKWKRVKVFFQQIPNKKARAIISFGKPVPILKRGV